MHSFLPYSGLVMKSLNDRNWTNEKESKKHGMGENLQSEWENEPKAEDLLDAKALLITDSKAALEQIERLAKNGSALSMFYLGSIHHFGRYGVKQDYEISTYWWKLAASSGSIEAMWSLARYYEREIDGAHAENWYRKAAELDHSPSHFAIGLAHYQGDWLDHDIPKAIENLQKAEKLGHFLASHWLWHIYIKEDLGLAFKVKGWFKRLSLIIPYALWTVNYPNSDRLRP